MNQNKDDIKLFIDTLGCPKNFNDSEAAAGIWEKAGMSITEDPLEADAIMVNTCGFINDAKKESIEHIFNMIELASAREEEGTGRPLLCVSGCLSQRYGQELYEEMPEVDVFLGVNEYERLPQILREHIGQRQAGPAGGTQAGETGSVPAAGENGHAAAEAGHAAAEEKGAHGKRSLYTGCAADTFEEFSARRLGENPYSATLRIAEGCNNRCAYCVIPQIRGGYRSRRMEDILSEAETLAGAGCRELILIAQDVTEYGRDLYGELRLPQLLQKLAEIGGIRWIRLMYCYEDKITEELVQVMAEEPKICHYIDIPLQHCADPVLKEMGRRSTNAGIRATLERLRRAIPDIHIRTTFITGFPGETEEDFEELSAFAQEMRFERLGVFAYSQEEGTPAGDREDQIDEEIRAARADEIMRHQVDISREVNREKVGSILEVLVESADEEGAWSGRTQYDAPEIDGTVIFTSEKELRPGDMVRVRITDAFDYDLVGETE